MIFAATHRQVLRGEKRQDRRPMVPYPTELPPRPAPGVGHHPAPAQWPRKVVAFDQAWRALNYQAGDVRAVQPGRGKPAVAHITIQHVRCERLGEITDGDAVAEGFKNRAAFVYAWVGLHDKAWARFTDELLAQLAAHPDQFGRLARDLGVSERTLVSRLRVMQAAGAVRVDAHTGMWDRCEAGEHVAREHRFDDRHARRPVWVVTFDLVTDPAVMLAARPPRAAGTSDEGADTPENRGYTLSAYQAISREGVDEALDAGALARMTADQRSAARVRVESETRDVRDQLRVSIDELAARPDLGEVAARRLANMRRELKRLDAELRGAA